MKAAPGTISAAQSDELEGRALSVELAARLGCYSQKKGGTEYLAIPYLRGGKIVNHKYRTLAGPKKFYQDADADKCFWNIDALSDETLSGQPIIVTEGELDAFAAIQCGHLRTMSVPDGAPGKELGGAETDKYTYVPEALKKITPLDVVILATDGDPPGENLMKDLALRFGKPRCKYLVYPMARSNKRRLKDLNEVLEEYGERGVNETLARAQWVSRPGIYSMSQRPPRAERKKYPLHMGEALDKLLKIRRGDFWVISGKPGHGKSSLADDIFCRLALHEGLRTCFASFEKEPETDHRRDLRKWFIGETRGHGNNDTWRPHEIKMADDFIEKAFRFAVPSDEEDASLEWLIEQFEIAVLQHSCDVLVIDPWNEVEHVRPPDMSLTEYTGWAVKRLKRLAKHLDVTVVVVAHPAKMKMDEELSLYSISDSAHWANKCDAGVLVRRKTEEGGGTNEILVAKARNEDIGKYGKVSAMLDIVTRHFTVFD